jgi:hypothetical protein
MPFSAQELESISNGVLDFHQKGDAAAQSVQDKPLLSMLYANKKNFAAGKEFITGNVKGDYTTTGTGFTHNDTVGYNNPSNLKRYQYAWKERHYGIEVTGTELKKAGITVTDGVNLEGTTRHTGSEVAVITDLLVDKLDDMEEGCSRDMNNMLWGDGTADSEDIPGIMSVIRDDPAPGVAETVGGLSSATTWWRNRASLGIATNAATQPILTKLQTEWRQLRRFGGKPDHIFAGSDLLSALEAELRANGSYTDTGWVKGGRLDGAMAELGFKGVAIQYDPTLDDLGRSKFCYVIDSRRIRLRPMEGEDMKFHSPDRPHNQYVYYKAKTFTGGLECSQRNCHGVYSIA